MASLLTLVRLLELIRSCAQLYTWLCGLFAALGSVTFGYDLGIIAAVLPCPDFLERTGTESGDYKQGLIVGMLLLGAFASETFIGSIADRFGRRLAIMFGCSEWIRIFTALKRSL